MTGKSFVQNYLKGQLKNYSETINYFYDCPLKDLNKEDLIRLIQLQHIWYSQLQSRVSKETEEALNELLDLRSKLYDK